MATNPPPGYPGSDPGQGPPQGPPPGSPQGPPPGYGPPPGVPYPPQPPAGPGPFRLPGGLRWPRNLPGGFPFPFPGQPGYGPPPGMPGGPPAQAPPSQGPPVQQSPDAPAMPPGAAGPTDGPAGNYTCQWCGMSSQDPGQSCPSCGAPVDVRRVQDTAGWSQLPSVKDMARIQFGQSKCQIEGTIVPVADVALDGGESVYFSHHVLLWREDGVNVETMRMQSGWKRMLAGMPLVMCQASGQGHIAFSEDAAGEIVALPIQVGTAVQVREHTMLIASGTTSYTWEQSGIWFGTVQRKGNEMERETHFPMGQFLDRFTAQQRPGLVLLHAKGNSFVRQLAPGQTVLVKPTALLYKDISVSMQLHFEHPSGTWRTWRAWGDRYLWLRCTGPGRIAVESAFQPVEDPGFDLAGSSPATAWRW